MTPEQQLLVLETEAKRTSKLEREHAWIICGLISTGLYFWYSLLIWVATLRDYPRPDISWVAVIICGIAWTGLIFSNRAYTELINRRRNVAGRVCNEK